jgi:hypothetical protein
MQLPHVLDAEFKRVAKAEGKSMEALVEEVAALVGYRPRQIYNFRSGKWDIPSSLIPRLCNRFHSRALLDALIDECGETRVEVPDNYELTCIVSQTVRDDLRHYEKFLAAFEDSEINERELAELRESGARVISNVKKFEAIAEADCDRQQRAQAARRSE